MFFLGTTFFGARDVIDPSPTMAKDIKNIDICDGIYNQIFVSRNSDLNVEAGYDDWDYDTVINAAFEKTLDAGNSSFSLNTTDTILVKCREKGTFNWITIYTKNIETLDDFRINLKDYYRPSQKDYEYMVVSYCNGVENAYVTQTVYSEFEGLYICDKDNIYGTLYELDFVNSTVTTGGTILNLLNSEYPSIVNNSNSNYESGSTSGSFIRFDQQTGQVNVPGGNDYRSLVKKWLNNKRPKVLKFYDGRIWLIGINGAISDSAENHNDNRKLSFDWIEIGDVNNPETLYSNGLSDVGREWWY